MKLQGVNSYNVINTFILQASFQPENNETIQKCHFHRSLTAENYWYQNCLKPRLNTAKIEEIFGYC